MVLRSVYLLVSPNGNIFLWHHQQVNVLTCPVKYLYIYLTNLNSIWHGCSWSMVPQRRFLTMIDDPQCFLCHLHRAGNCALVWNIITYWMDLPAIIQGPQKMYFNDSEISLHQLVRWPRIFTEAFIVTRGCIHGVMFPLAWPGNRHLRFCLKYLAVIV